MKMPLAGLIFPVAGTVCLCLLGGCGSSSGSAAPRIADGGPGVVPTEPTDPRAEPLPPRSQFVVQGEVFAFDTGMIAEADINLWVQTGGFGYSYWWANGPLMSDGLGQFRADVPGSVIDILAVQEGFVQPCGVRLGVREDADVRVEMISVASLNSTHPPRPQSSTEPSLTGTLFEDTPDGRQIVSGAQVWIEDGIGVGYAYTQSDPAGHYYLCNLPTGSAMWVTKDGFEDRYLGPIDTSESLVLDIVLERAT